MKRVRGVAREGGVWYCHPGRQTLRGDKINIMIENP